MTILGLTAIDSIGRAATIHPYIQGGATLMASYSLHQDPGTGSLTGSNHLTQFTVTGGTPEALRATAQLIRDHQNNGARIEPWHSQALAYADSLEALANQSATVSV